MFDRLSRFTSISMNDLGGSDAGDVFRQRVDGAAPERR
jgi:hypothetical protein